MASAQAVRLLEAIYAKIDGQVREIVKSMLPPVTIAAQEEGTVVANDHRILNFQGAGVSVNDEPSRRRVNVYIPGAPTASSDNTYSSSTSAKAHSLWSGGGSLTMTHLANGTEGGGTTIGTIALPPFTGSFTIGVSSDVANPRILNMTYSFVNTTTPSTCFNNGISMIFGSGTSHTRTVGEAGYTWSCLDWDTLYWQMGGATDPLVSGTTYTFTITASGLPAGGNATPPANWDQPSFSDGSWGSAVVAGMESGEVAPGSSSPVWATSAAVSTTEEVLLRRTFSLPTGTIASASLDLAANDTLADSATHVNGTSVSTPLLSAGAIRTFSIPVSLLTAGGPNLLAFWGKNTSGTKAWVGWELTVNYVAPGTDDQYIPWSTMTTKGDLIVGTGAGTGVRHGVGTNGYVLTARSSSSDGVAWEAPVLLSAQDRVDDMVTLLNATALRQTPELRDAVARVFGIQPLTIPLNQDATAEDIVPL